MTPLRRRVAAALSLAAMLAIPAAAQAHRPWLLPSSTVLSGQDPWITVDAAVSDDLFDLDHAPLRLDGLVVTAPGGGVVEPKNALTGKFRSTFDLELAQPGTYKLASVTGGTMAAYQLNGEAKRWRGAPGDLATAIPKEATEVKITQSERRVETFVTAGSPTRDTLKISGHGLELDPITHPNDLAAGQPASFRLMLDGKPATGVEIELVAGGGRYRDQVGAVRLKTDAKGVFQVTWPATGMYWLEAEMRLPSVSLPGAERSTSYVATLEVLPD